MTAPGNQGSVHLVAIGVHLLAPIRNRNVSPKRPGGLKVAPTDGKRDYLSGTKRDRRPEPEGTFLGLQECPHLIALEIIAFASGQDGS